MTSINSSYDLGLLFLENQQQTTRESKNSRDALHEIGLTHLALANVYKAEKEASKDAERAMAYVNAALSIVSLATSGAQVKGAVSADAARMDQATKTVEGRWSAQGRTPQTPEDQLAQRQEILVEKQKLDQAEVQRFQDREVFTDDPKEQMKLLSFGTLEEAVKTGNTVSGEQYKNDDEADSISEEEFRRAAQSLLDTAAISRDMVETDREIETEMVRLQAVLRKKS